MTRILYGFCGVGMGHFVRNKEIISELSKKHEILVVCSGEPYKKLSNEMVNVYDTKGFELFFKNNKIINLKTLKKNIQKFNQKTFNNLKKIDKIVLKFKPQVVISDWETYSSYKARELNLPLISIDNQHYLIYGKYDTPLIESFQKWKAEIILKSLVKEADVYIIFLYPGCLLQNKKDIYGVNPLIRKELFNINISDNGFFLVYQSTQDYNAISKILRKIDKKFIIYGFNKEKVDGNLIFKRFTDSQKFIDDLSSCSGVITNGGFTLISEAMFLGKPLFVVPIVNHFEQVLNALYVRKNKLGIYSEDFNEKKLKRFVNTSFSLKKSKMKSNKDLFKLLDEVIKSFVL